MLNIVFLFWNKFDRESSRKKIPSIWLHIVNLVVDKLHEITILWIIVNVVVLAGLVSEKEVIIAVVSSVKRNRHNGSVLPERSVGENVLSFVLIVWVVDAVKRHLVEKRFKFD